MALITCHECKHQVSSTARKCPNCGAVPKSKANTISAIVSVVGGLGFAAYFFLGGVERQVSNDFVKQYAIAQQSGKPIDICVQAGMVSAAYLQAKDQENYEKWKKIEASDCAAAGLTI